MRQIYRLFFIFIYFFTRTIFFRYRSLLQYQRLYFVSVPPRPSNLLNPVLARPRRTDSIPCPLHSAVVAPTIWTFSRIPVFLPAPQDPFLESYVDLPSGGNIAKIANNQGLNRHIRVVPRRYRGTNVGEQKIRDCSFIKSSAFRVFSETSEEFRCVATLTRSFRVVPYRSELASAVGLSRPLI